MGDSDVTLGELVRELRVLRVDVAADLEEIKREVREVRGEMLSREVFEARHAAQGNELRLELAGIRTHFDGEIRRVENKADDAIAVAASARSVGMWAVGLLATALFAAVALVLTEIIAR